MKKKVVSLLLAVLMVLSTVAILPMTAFAEPPATVPTVYDVSDAGYNVTEKYVLVVYFDEPITNDVVWTGTYNAWSTNVGEMKKFEALDGFSGWYVAEFEDKSSQCQGKIFQLMNDGSFNTSFQSGDVEAWINMAQPSTKQMTVNTSASGETICTLPEKGVYIYEMTEFIYPIIDGTAEGDKDTNHGYISIDKTTAKKNATVTVTVKPDEGYPLKTLKYNDGTDHEITADAQGAYKFTMPAKAVTVTATFETTTEKPVDTTLYWGFNETTKAFYLSKTSAAITEKGVSANEFDSTQVFLMEKDLDLPWKDDCDSVQSVEILNDIAPGNTAAWFRGMEKLTGIVGIEYLHTGNVTSMATMFANCEALASLDVSHFDTSAVTNMNDIFNECAALTTLDVRNFDTSKVTTMEKMFRGCAALESLDLSNFNTSNVTDMLSMFNGCTKLQSLDLSNFDTSKVDNMEMMFQWCPALRSLDLSGFNTTKVQYMRFMFYGCSSLASLDLSGFNTTSVTDMREMFNGCSSLASLDLPKSDTPELTTVNSMFKDCTSLKTVDLSNFDLSKCTGVVSAGSIFSNCSAVLIKTPKNLGTNLRNANLPTVEGPVKWLYADTLTEYESNSLPAGQESSITLVAGVPVETWSELQDAINAAPGDATTPATATTNIILKNDLTAPAEGGASITIPEGKDITIDLNGKVLNANGKFGVIKTSGKLTVIDSAPTTEHYFTVGDNGLWTLTGTKTETTKTVKGGVITGGYDIYFGGVYVHKDATFDMNGGSIVGNTATGVGNVAGGGVNCQPGSSFTMTNSSICGNVAASGAGGVNGSGSESSGKFFNFTMTNSSVCGNTCPEGTGGVSLTENANFTMINSSIADNVGGEEDVGGVCVSESSFTMTGSSITGNMGGISGGVCVSDGSFTIINSRITDNTADMFGGGVLVFDGEVVLGGTTVIEENLVGETASNLVLFGSNPVTLGTKTASSDGNGVPVPADSMSVGVTMATPGTFTGTATETQKGYFSSDNSGYEVAFNTDHLELAEPVDTYAITNGAPESAKETNHGYITVDETAAEGETVTVTVNPATGYQLKTLKYNDGTTDYDITKDATSGNYQFTMPAKAVTVTAEFEEAPTSSIYATTYTSNVEFTTDGGTQAAAAKVVIDNTNYDAIKAGSAGTAGVCVVTIPATTKVLHFHAAGFNGKSVTLDVNGTEYTLVADAGYTGSSPFTLQNAPSTNDYFTFDPKGATTITFTATNDKRFVLFGVNVEMPEGYVWTPSISAESTAFEESVEVSLFCNTEGASIYYTLDGTTPSASSTKYEAPFTLTATTTVKAVAVKDGKSSDVAEETFTKAVFTSLEELVTKFPATDVTKKVTVTITDAVIEDFYVSGKGYTNGIYVTVAGTTVEIYYNDVPATWEAGGKVSGTIKAEWLLYKGVAELQKWDGGWDAFTYTPAYAITDGTAQDANGTISIDKETATEGETVTVTVNPATGYQLKTLKYNDGTTDYDITKDATTGEYQFTMPASAVTVTAEFEEASAPAWPEDAPTTAPAAPAHDGASILGIALTTDYAFEPLDWPGNMPVKLTFATGETIYYLDKMNWQIYTNWDEDFYDMSQYSMLHIDLFPATGTEIKITFEGLSVDDGGQGYKNSVVKTLTAGQWNSFDIALSEFPALSSGDSYDFSDIRYLILEGYNDFETALSVGNVYFYGAPAHTHTGVKQNGQPATETAAGYKDYYKCSCGLYFEEEACTTLIGDDTALAAWKAEGGNGYRQILPHSHNFVKQNAVNATADTAGCKEYYICSCGEAYEDEALTQKITNLGAWKAEGGMGYIAPNGAGDPEPSDDEGTNLWWLWVLIAVVVVGGGFCVWFFFIRKKNDNGPKGPDAPENKPAPVAPVLTPEEKAARAEEKAKAAEAAWIAEAQKKLEESPIEETEDENGTEVVGVIFQKRAWKIYWFKYDGTDFAKGEIASYTAADGKQYKVMVAIPKIRKDMSAHPAELKTLQKNQ